MPIFNDDATKRISKVVKRVENAPTFTQNYSAPNGSSKNWFLAVLTSSYSSGYSWSYVHITDAPALQTQTAWGSSAQFTKAHHREGNQHLPSGEIVMMLSKNLFILTNNGTRTSEGLPVALTANGGNYQGIYNYFAKDIPAGTRIYYTAIGNKFHVISADCIAP